MPLVTRVDRGRARPVRRGARAAGSLFVDEPFGGEPMAVVSADTTRRRRKPAEAGGARRPPRQTARRNAGRPRPAGAPSAPEADARHPDRHHHRRLDRQAPGSDVDRRRQPAASRQDRAAGARSIRACSRPRVTARSRRSRPTARARPTSMRAPSSRRRPQADGPRIAIVIGGLGISANATAEALAKLPGAGDLRVRALRHRSRALGHARARRRPRSAAAGRRWSRSTIPTTIPARRRC